MSEVTINWYPGHMAKTRRLIEENLKLIDIVAEIIDARIPKSSRNPDFDQLLKGKKRIIVLNKADMADMNVTKRWQEYYIKQGISTVITDSKGKTGIKLFLPAIKEALTEEIERRNRKGTSGMALRVMVLGVPNAGKSTFINALAGSKRAKAEDRPGVTRGKQWITLEGGLDLLDMPGILWPKIEDAQAGLNLALTGAIKDEIMDMEYLSCHLLSLLKKEYESLLLERYKIKEETEDGYELLKAVAKKRGFLISGGRLDTERAAKIVIDEFRGGVIGKITLEKPEDSTKND